MSAVQTTSNIDCSRIFQEKLSGKNAERPELRKCLEFARPNDTITVTELWRRRSSPRATGGRGR